MCECCGEHNHFKTITLNVEGMSCNHCVMSIQKSVNALKGIKNVDVDLKEKKVKVEFNPNDVNEQIIRETIEDTGYEVK
jgi:copper chaperone